MVHRAWNSPSPIKRGRNIFFVHLHSRVEGLRSLRRWAEPLCGSHMITHEGIEGLSCVPFSFFLTTMSLFCASGQNEAPEPLMVGRIAGTCSSCRGFVRMCNERRTTSHVLQAGDYYRVVTLQAHQGPELPTFFMRYHEVQVAMVDAEHEYASAAWLGLGRCDSGC